MLPEQGSRAAEGSAPHRLETGRGDNEVNRGGGAECMGRSGNLDDVC